MLREVGARRCRSMSGYCTLTATSRPSSSRARVHLRERGGGERALVELANTASRGLPSSRSTRVADHREGLRRHGVVALLQPLDERGGKRSERVAIAWHSLDDHAAQVERAGEHARAPRARGSRSSVVPASLRAGRASRAPRRPGACRARTAAPRRCARRGRVRRSRVQRASLQALARPRLEARARRAASRRGSSASNSSSSAAGLGRPPSSPRSRLARMSSRCSRGRSRVIARRMRCSSPSTTSRPAIVPPSARAQRARAQLGERRAQVLDVRALVAADVAHHRAARLAARPRPPGRRAARSPQSKVPSAKTSTTSTCAIMREHALERLVELREAALAALAAPAVGPSCAAARRRGCCGFSSARSRAASHICLWPPSSR